MNTEKTVRSRRGWLSGVGAILAVIILLTPSAAYAASWWTFYNSTTTQSAVKTSQHWSGLRGASAGPPPGSPGANLDHYYIRNKTSSGALIISAKAEAGNTVTVSHSSRSDARSECYWRRFDAVGNPLSGGTAKLYCRSYKD
jgi:hypothetical protein